MISDSTISEFGPPGPQKSANCDLSDAGNASGVKRTGFFDDTSQIELRDNPEKTTSIWGREFKQI